MAVFNFIIAPGRSVESVSEKDPSFKRGHILDRAEAELQKLLDTQILVATLVGLHMNCMKKFKPGKIQRKSIGRKARMFSSCFSTA